MTAAQHRVLIVEDDQPLADALLTTLEGAGYHVERAADGSEALRLLDSRPVDLVISDVQMEPMDGHELMRELGASRPELPVMLMTAYGSIGQAVEAMRAGAIDYLPKPFESRELKARVADILWARSHKDSGVIAVDPASERVFALARRLAKQEVSVLLSGESGTGKEVMARYLHRHSARKDKPFVAINCAAIPDNMLEAVLFGYEKGSYTGAQTANVGKFRQANEGTLLLDEVSEMDLGLQAKLLRVLQEKEVEPLGGRGPIAVDVRLIATTNRDLKAFVGEGRFREDLYYRINVFPLDIPSLRSRPGDIEPLAHHFLQVIDPRKNLSDGALAALGGYTWPGNVRELSNVIQRAAIWAPGDVVEPEHLTLEPGRGTASPPSLALDGRLRSEEAKLIMDAIASAPTRKAAAENLGISPRTLRHKLARLRASGLVEGSP